MAPKGAIVVGASRGIGLAVAQRLQADGFTVGVTTRDVEPAGFEVAKCDVRDGASLSTALAELVVALPPLEALVYVAGVRGVAKLRRLSDDAFDEVLEVNLMGAHRSMRALVPDMVKRGSGRVVLVSSISSLYGSEGSSHYAASKAALIGYARSLVREIGGCGVTINVVAPGWIETDMTKVISPDMRSMLYSKIPLDRFGTSDEVAHVVSMLCAAEAGFVTGSVITIDGGQSMGL